MDSTVVDMREVIVDPRERATSAPRRRRHTVGHIIAAIEIVEAVTAGLADEGVARTLVRCPVRRQRRVCPGQLLAQLQSSDNGTCRVGWSCGECGGNGAVVGFRGTRWDLSAIDPESASARPIQTATLTHDAFRYAVAAAQGAPECERLTKAARVGRGSSAGRVELRGPAPWFALLRERAAVELLMSRGAQAVTCSRLLQALGHEPPPSWSDRIELSPLCLHADLDVHGWQLDDGEARHVAHPDSFWVPDLAERTSLLPGSIVKLIFAIRAADGELGFERMWVVVERALGNLFMGRLDNEPITGGRLAPGHPIFFSPEHVIDIWTDDSDPV